MKRIALAAIIAVAALLTLTPSSDADPVPFYLAAYEGHVEVTSGGDVSVVVFGANNLPVPMARGYAAVSVRGGAVDGTVDCRGDHRRPDGDVAFDTADPAGVDASEC